jgi:ACS family hexuronate transporter-like MFS transporter
MVSRWTLLALLFASITINLLDRQVLSVMAPYILEELKLTASDYSNIVFAFTLGLTLAQVPAGMWLDRRGARYGLPAIMALWSAANALHGVARTVWHFALFRFLLGAGECGNYSAGVKVIAQRFPAHERALAGGLFNSGTVIGAFLAPPVLVWIASHFGWRLTFLFPSLLGLLWIVPWVLLYRDAGPAAAWGARQPFLPLLRHRQVWGVMLMRALAGPVVHFYWYWLPEYLKRERGFSMELIGLLAGLPFLFAGIGNIAGGSAAALLMRRGWSADRTRKTLWTSGAALCGASLLVPAASGRAAAIALICTATFGLAALAANHIGTLTDIFPPRIMAAVTGLTGLCEGVFNMFFTLMTGRIVDAFSFVPVFAAAGLLPALAAMVLFVVVRRVEPLEVGASGPG